MTQIKDNQSIKEQVKVVGDNEYSPAVNLSEAISEETNTKYRIREGMLHNSQKDIVRKKGENWFEFFTSNHGATPRRSPQDYMALARIPK